MKPVGVVGTGLCIPVFVLLLLLPVYSYANEAEAKIEALISEESIVSAEEGKGDGFVFLSGLHGRCLWAKYITDNDAFNWNGQLGIDWDILKYKNYYGYLLVNMETIIEEGGSGLSFDPDYIRYMLEPGLRIEGKKGDLSLIYHHICRHDVDRFDKSTEKWDVLGVRLESKRHVPQTFSPETEYLWKPFGKISFGKCVNTTDVTYDWDGMAEAGMDILRYKRAIFYLSNNVRLVFQKEDRPSDKKYFIDYTFEPGIKIYGEKGEATLFCQYRHEHDVDMYNGTTEDWGLVGVRYEW